MNSVVSLIVILSLYYYIYNHRYDIVCETYHYYFYTFIGIYVAILYVYHFEYPFFYKTLKNVYDTSNKPLYSHNSRESNVELFESQYPNFNIKETLLAKQGQRCQSCSNFILKDDLHNYKLKYKTHLQEGGQNSVDNIGLVCPACFAYN